MATEKGRAVRRHFSTLFNLGVIRDLTDGQLLERYATGQGEAAELAFAAIVERHGPMVLPVCRARLGNPHEALDAFQATFLVLIKKSRGLWVKNSLGPWLHQVAYRTASCARRAAARRREAEQTAAELAATHATYESEPNSEWEQALHEEINRLPARYRTAIVLCDLEGHTCEAVARQLGRPVGTVKSWRARGRERLRQRLIRSGLTLPAGAALAVAASSARAAILAPEAAAAVRILTETLAAGVVPASVQLLLKGVFQAMILSKLRTAAAVILGLMLVTGDVGTVTRVAGGDTKPPGEQARTEPAPPVSAPQPTPAPTNEKAADETWRLTLRDAIRVGLDNRDGVRVLSFTTPNAVGGDATNQAHEVACTVSPLNPGEDFQSFRFNVMEFVRSIEQQYWILARNYVRRWAAEKTVHSAQAILKGVEQARKSGRGSDADVAAAKQRLEEFSLNLVKETSNVITTERQLRNLIGLPPADNRRIVPVTAPIEAKIEPDWDTSLKSMLEHYPDIIQTRETLRAKEADAPVTDLDKVARTVLPDLPAQEAKPESSKTAHGWPALLPEAGQLRQVIHQQTHSLARFYLEIDANYKQYQTAKKLRTAAAERLEAQRKFYEEGQITIDKLLDALKQYGEAVAQEAEHKCTYNIATALFEEAKGTLLDYDKITVATHPQAGKSNPSKPRSARRDRAAMAASFPPPVPIALPAPARPAAAAPTPAPLARDPRRSQAGPDPTKAAAPGITTPGQTISFDVTIRVAGKPVQICGSFTISPAEPPRNAPPR